VEVKVQQRRPDGGSIPPIARIVSLFVFRTDILTDSENFFLLVKERGESCELVE
jgi:hypothetical protein